MTTQEELAALTEEVVKLKRDLGVHRRALVIMPILAAYLLWLSWPGRGGRINVDDAILVGNSPGAVVNSEYISLVGQDKRVHITATNGLALMKGSARFSIDIENGQLVVSGTDGNGDTSSKSLLGASTLNVSDQITIGDDIRFDNSEPALEPTEIQSAPALGR
jgi:hypothetical protein